MCSWWLDILNIRFNVFHCIRYFDQNFGQLSTSEPNNRHIGTINFYIDKSNKITFILSPGMIFSVVFLKMTRFVAMKTSQCFILVFPLLVFRSLGSLFMPIVLPFLFLK